MQVTHLAAHATRRVELSAGREIKRQSVFLETGDARAQSRGVGGSEGVQRVPHREVGVGRGLVRELALGGDASDAGAGAGAEGEGEEVGG